MANKECAMKTTLDRFGRLVVPKKIRNKLGLRAGSAIEIEEHENEIVLKPAGHEAPLQMEGGLLVFAGSAVGDIAGAVRAHREERLANIAPGRKA
jgi:AbrB family looped-hinge helix DNA binding protein